MKNILFRSGIMLSLVLLLIVKAKAQKNYSVEYNEDGFSGRVALNVKLDFYFEPYFSAGISKAWVNSYKGGQYDAMLREAGITFPYELKDFRFDFSARARIYKEKVINQYASVTFNCTDGLGSGQEFPPFSSATKEWLKKHDKDQSIVGGAMGGGEDFWKSYGRLENINVTKIYITDFKNKVESAIRKYESDQKAEKEKKEAEEKKKIAEKEKAEEKEKQAQLEEQQKKEAAQKEAETKQAASQESAYARSSSGSSSSSSQSSSAYSSGGSRTSYQSQQERREELQRQQRQRNYENNMRKYQAINHQIAAIDQAHKQFNESIDRAFAPLRDKARADQQASRDWWAEVQETSRRKEEEERERQREQEIEQQRESERQDNFYREVGAVRRQKRAVIENREKLFKGKDWKLTPTFDVFAKNREPLYIFFVEMEANYNSLNDFSSYSSDYIRIIINEHPKMKISPLIEVKPTSSGEYPFPEDIIKKIKKDYNLTSGKTYKFHNWTKDKAEFNSSYNAFIDQAGNTDFAVDFLEDQGNSQEENSEYWNKNAKSSQDKNTNYWNTSSSKTPQKAQAKQKDYWSNPGSSAEKKETTKTDYWK